MKTLLSQDPEPDPIEALSLLRDPLHSPYGFRYRAMANQIVKLCSLARCPGGCRKLVGTRIVRFGNPYCATRHGECRKRFNESNPPMAKALAERARQLHASFESLGGTKAGNRRILARIAEISGPVKQREAAARARIKEIVAALPSPYGRPRGFLSLLMPTKPTLLGGAMPERPAQAGSAAAPVTPKGPARVFLADAQGNQ